MQEIIIQLIISGSGVLISIVGVVLVLAKKLETKQPISTNGFAKLAEISGLHEKINKGAMDQNDRCADRLEKCNCSFTDIKTTLAEQKTLLLGMAIDIKEIKNGKPRTI